jgi:hypothetical protein
VFFTNENLHFIYITLCSYLKEFTFRIGDQSAKFRDFSFKSFHFIFSMPWDGSCTSDATWHLEDSNDEFSPTNHFTPPPMDLRTEQSFVRSIRRLSSIMAFFHRSISLLRSWESGSTISQFGNRDRVSPDRSDSDAEISRPVRSFSFVHRIAISQFWNRDRVSTDRSNSDAEILRPLGIISSLDYFTSPARFVVLGWCCPNSFGLNRKCQASVPIAEDKWLSGLHERRKVTPEEFRSHGILIDPG